MWNHGAGRMRHTFAIITAIVVMAGIVACSHAETPPASSSSQDSRRELVMPNLIGKYWSEASAELHQAGWGGSLNKGPNVPGEPQNRNRVMSQLPSAGEHIKNDDPITLQFGI